MPCHGISMIQSRTHLQEDQIVLGSSQAVWLLEHHPRPRSRRSQNWDSLLGASPVLTERKCRLARERVDLYD